MATDEQLIQQIQKGESEAYGQLFSKYYKQIYSVCLAILKNPHDAEEVTSETFVHAYLKLNQLRKPDRFSAWLKKIAENLSKNYLRDRREDIIPLSLASTQTVDDEIEPVQPGVAPVRHEVVPLTQTAPDEHLLKQELIDSIMEAVEALPPKDREVVKAHIDGLNHSEISERLGISVQSSMSRLYRARKKIAAHVKNLLNCIIGLPKTLPFKKIVSGGIEAMKVGTSKEVTTGIITVTQSLTFSVIFHIALFIALSFVLPYKFHSDRQKVDVYLELSLLPPAKEQQPAQRPSKGEAKSDIVKSSFPQIKRESPSKTPRGFLSAEKPASQEEIGEAIIRIGQGMRELPIGLPAPQGTRQAGAGVNVKGRERILSGNGKGEEILPTVGVGGESVSEVGKVGVGLAGEVGRLAKGRSGVDLEMKKVERLAPVSPQKEKFDRQAGLSIVGDIGVADADDILANVAKDMMLDRTEFGVPELPKREPGGIVIGKGKDIRGYLRFPRVDCSMLDRNLVETYFGKAMLNLMKWVNANTNIRVDMNVEGGGIQLTDTTLFKSPVIFLLGHTGEISTGSGLIHHWEHSYSYGRRVRVSSHLTDTERKRLREYLVQKGGILVVDAWPRLNAIPEGAAEYPWSVRMKRELEGILPEYRFEKIPNDHELYHCYYALNGPPQWKFCENYYRSSPYLEGIFIDGRLAVIYSENGYSVSMSGHWAWAPTIPSIFRLMTNIVVYGLTHSGISDKSRYVPEKEAQEEIPTKPPIIPPPTPNLRP